MKRIIYIFIFFCFQCMFNPISKEKAIQEFKPLNAEFVNYTYKEKKIHYVKVGENKKNLILFIHGSPGSWDNFKVYLKDEDLLEKAILISVDRLGYGGSEKGIPEKSLAKQADSFFPILEKYKNYNIILVGHSFGGPVSVQLAADFNTYIKNIILLAPSLDPKFEELLWYQKFANNSFVRFLLPSPIDVCNQEIYTLREELILQKDLYKNINSKILILHGKSDNLVPVGNVEYLENQILKKENFKKIILEDTNHFLVWNRYEIIKKEILEILK